MKNVHILIASLILLNLYSCKKQPKVITFSSLEVLNGDILLCGSGDFGTVDFATSCTTESSEMFNLGLSLLHSFEYTEAEKAFAKVLEVDPNCAIAFWGIAMCNFHSLWMQAGNAHLIKGNRLIEATTELKTTDRERAYINAIGAFYKDWQTVPHKQRIYLFEEGMRSVYETYPEDKEAAIFYALALRAIANPSDKTFKNQLKSGKILKSIFPSAPNHPGIAHYLIHNYDYPELAEKALPTAREYAKIAPASAHAQHMPSHIFTRLGLWEEAIASNLKSTEAALCYAEALGATAHWDEELHGMDYLVYAYLQLGANDKAAEQYDYLKTFYSVFPVNFKCAYAIAAIPGRIALENKDWEGAAQLELPEIAIPWEQFPWERSLYYFTKGYGAIRLGLIEEAEQELKAIKTAHRDLQKAENNYLADQVAIEIANLEAWMLFRKGSIDSAIQRMQEAKDMENNTQKHPVTPGELIPAAELLADLYMENGNIELAHSAYLDNLNQHPQRFNGLYGAAKTASMLNDLETAKMYFQQLLDLGQAYNSQRPELLEAKTFLEP
ncbi:tetratricopeptide repeat protein [Aegicerativicinus sediminis]|uniref:tetratricopeptide repeat protein n=1 Tax=Aegicerativicinus sediminis TaxID=2893202 RepID=UPI001E48813F|nr:hypothetical protein [Aegicerativicinus sediminis]